MLTHPNLQRLNLPDSLSPALRGRCDKVLKYVRAFELDRAATDLGEIEPDLRIKLSR
jgi:hypothetical protein